MRKFVLFLSLLVLACSCTAISSLIHDDEVVAKVGRYKLYRSDLGRFIPENVSPEDSARLAANYINTWAQEYLYMQVAEQQLSKAEMDVTAELEDYRHSLIRFRYEQRYINDRLDTLITEEQLNEYYTAHLDEFKLSRPVLKVRFLNILKDSPYLAQIVDAMSVEEEGRVPEADTLGAAYALKYYDRSETWTDAAQLALLFGVDASRMLSVLKDNLIIIEPEDRGDVMVAYVCDIQREGTAPLEYVEDRIRDIIISNRKHKLLKSLEQDLLTDALERKNFVIYQQ